MWPIEQLYIELGLKHTQIWSPYISQIQFYHSQSIHFRKKEDQSNNAHENSIEMRQSEETVACTVEDVQCQPETVNQSDQISNHSLEKSINRSKITIAYSTMQLFFQRWKDWALTTSNNFFRKL